jgi:hypothetical protein
VAVYGGVRGVLRRALQRLCFVLDCLQTGRAGSSSYLEIALNKERDPMMIEAEEIWKRARKDDPNQEQRNLRLLDASHGLQLQ